MNTAKQEENAKLKKIKQESITWLHSPDTLLNNKVSYRTKFLGHLPVSEHRGIDIIKGTMDKLTTKSVGPKTRIVNLTINIEGIEISDPKTKVYLHQCPLRHITYFADYKLQKNSYIGFVVREMNLPMDSFSCFIFLSDKKAEDIVLTIAQAFELAYKSATPVTTSAVNVALDKSLTNSIINLCISGKKNASLSEAMSLPKYRTATPNRMSHVNKPTPRFRHLEQASTIKIRDAASLPSNFDYSDGDSVNESLRSFATMGMERKEEREISFVNAITRGSTIPIPKRSEVLSIESYKMIYQENPIPERPIKIHPFDMFWGYIEYDLDIADRRWVYKNKKKFSELTEEEFARCVQSFEAKSWNRPHLVMASEVKNMFRNYSEAHKAIYRYWFNKRVSWRVPLIPYFLSDTRMHCFPPNTFGKYIDQMQTRKAIRNAEDNFEKMLSLAEDLSKAVELFDLVEKREMIKKEILSKRSDVFLVRKLLLRSGELITEATIRKLNSLLNHLNNLPDNISDVREKILSSLKIPFVIIGKASRKGCSVKYKGKRVSVSCQVEQSLSLSSVDCQVDEHLSSPSVDCRVDENSSSPSVGCKVNGNISSSSVDCQVDEHLSSPSVDCQVDENSSSPSVGCKVNENISSSSVDCQVDKSFRKIRRRVGSNISAQDIPCQVDCNKSPKIPRHVYIKKCRKSHRRVDNNCFPSTTSCQVAKEKLIPDKISDSISSKKNCSQVDGNSLFFFKIPCEAEDDTSTPNISSQVNHNILSCDINKKIDSNVTNKCKTEPQNQLLNVIPHHPFILPYKDPNIPYFENIFPSNKAGTKNIIKNNTDADYSHIYAEKEDFDDYAFVSEETKSLLDSAIEIEKPLIFRNNFDATSFKRRAYKPKWLRDNAGDGNSRNFDSTDDFENDISDVESDSEPEVEYLDSNNSPPSACSHYNPYKSDTYFYPTKKWLSDDFTGEGVSLDEKFKYRKITGGDKSARLRVGRDGRKYLEFSDSEKPAPHDRKTIFETKHSPYSSYALRNFENVESFIRMKNELTNFETVHPLSLRCEHGDVKEMIARILKCMTFKSDTNKWIVDSKKLDNILLSYKLQNKNDATVAEDVATHTDNSRNESEKSYFSENENSVEGSIFDYSREKFSREYLQNNMPPTQSNIQHNNRKRFRSAIASNIVEQFPFLNSQNLDEIMENKKNNRGKDKVKVYSLCKRKIEGASNYETAYSCFEPDQANILFRDGRQDITGDARDGISGEKSYTKTIKGLKIIKNSFVHSYKNASKNRKIINRIPSNSLKYVNDNMAENTINISKTGWSESNAISKLNARNESVSYESLTTEIKPDERSLDLSKNDSAISCESLLDSLSKSFVENGKPESYIADKNKTGFFIFEFNSKGSQDKEKTTLYIPRKTFDERANRIFGDDIFKVDSSPTRKRDLDELTTTLCHKRYKRMNTIDERIVAMTKLNSQDHTMKVPSSSTNKNDSKIFVERELADQVSGESVSHTEDFETIKNIMKSENVQFDVSSGFSDSFKIEPSNSDLSNIVPLNESTSSEFDYTISSDEEIPNEVDISTLDFMISSQNLSMNDMSHLDNAALPEGVTINMNGLSTADYVIMPNNMIVNEYIQLDDDYTVPSSSLPFEGSSLSSTDHNIFKNITLNGDDPSTLDCVISSNSVSTMLYTDVCKSPAEGTLPPTITELHAIPENNLFTPESHSPVPSTSSFSSQIISNLKQSEVEDSNTSKISSLLNTQFCEMASQLDSSIDISNSANGNCVSSYTDDKAPFQTDIIKLSPGQHLIHEYLSSLRIKVNGCFPTQETVTMASCSSVTTGDFPLQSNMIITAAQQLNLSNTSQVNNNTAVSSLLADSISSTQEAKSTVINLTEHYNDVAETDESAYICGSSVVTNKESPTHCLSSIKGSPVTDVTDGPTTAKILSTQIDINDIGNNMDALKTAPELPEPTSSIMVTCGSMKIGSLGTNIEKIVTTDVSMTTSSQPTQVNVSSTQVNDIITTSSSLSPSDISTQIDNNDNNNGSLNTDSISNYDNSSDPLNKASSKDLTVMPPNRPLYYLINKSSIAPGNQLPMSQKCSIINNTIASNDGKRYLRIVNSLPKNFALTANKRSILLYPSINKHVPTTVSSFLASKTVPLIKIVKPENVTQEDFGESSKSISATPILTGSQSEKSFTNLMRTSNANSLTLFNENILHDDSPVISQTNDSASCNQNISISDPANAITTNESILSNSKCFIRIGGSTVRLTKAIPIRVSGNNIIRKASPYFVRRIPTSTQSIPTASQIMSSASDEGKNKNCKISILPSCGVIDPSSIQKIPPMAEPIQVARFPVMSTSLQGTVRQPISPTSLGSVRQPLLTFLSSTAEQLGSEILLKTSSQQRIVQHLQTSSQAVVNQPVSMLAHSTVGQEESDSPSNGRQSVSKFLQSTVGQPIITSTHKTAGYLTSSPTTESVRQPCSTFSQSTGRQLTSTSLQVKTIRQPLLHILQKRLPISARNVPTTDKSSLYPNISAVLQNFPNSQNYSSSVSQNVTALPKNQFSPIIHLPGSKRIKGAKIKNVVTPKVKKRCATKTLGDCMTESKKLKLTHRSLKLNEVKDSKNSKCDATKDLETFEKDEIHNSITLKSEIISHFKSTNSMPESQVSSVTIPTLENQDNAKCESRKINSNNRSPVHLSPSSNFNSTIEAPANECLEKPLGMGRRQRSKR